MWLFYEAVYRILNPEPINALFMMITAGIGLACNIIMASSLHSHGHSHGHDHGHSHNHSHKELKIQSHDHSHNNSQEDPHSSKKTENSHIPNKISNKNNQPIKVSDS